jgi:hypothetical protein
VVVRRTLTVVLGSGGLDGCGGVGRSCPDG